MARYGITFDNGHKQTISASRVEYIAEDQQYVFTDGRGQVVALIPLRNVLSVVRAEDEVTD